MEVRAERYVFQSVGLVPSTERASARSRHKPQAQTLTGLLDQADDHQIGVPLFHYRESALLHGREPIAGSTGSRNQSLRADQLDPVDSREGTRDGFPILSAIVLQPTQDDAKTVFGRLWVVRPIALKSELHPRRRPNVRVKGTHQPSYRGRQDHSAD